eukprot:GHRR01015603.1.p1 GENE.GHRR01015603.1~~GHRR01015603.1.p1  ORF type:complete len:611 (+),score=225.96 GHRR01015603.1:1751-3583(+)
MPITLLQDFFDNIYETQRLFHFPRCDSSDCLVCQGQRTFCSQEVTRHVCSWLGRRLRSSADDAATYSATASVPSDNSSATEPRQHKRLKRASSQDSDLGQRQSLAGDQPISQHAAQDASPSRVRLDNASSWVWQPEFASRAKPAPCRMVEVARLQSPGSACITGRNDMICGLDFSIDGQLLAAAGVSKQVALYSLAGLCNMQSDWADEQQQSTTAAAIRQSSSQTWQTEQQQQQHVGSLPPVAVVRLPGKVSSVAWSPDIDGVISIGDYDGTLTQVHVASGHYLNEVDAHGGRRIWSVCHSSLRQHFAATASDDCTAKLWAGHGLSVLTATISLPGKPAVCGVDFSQHHEFLLALAAADARVYIYDLRSLSSPLALLQGHQRPVSYAKFFGPTQLVSASIDGTLAAWDVAPVLGLSSSTTSSSSASMSSNNSSWQQQQQQCDSFPLSGNGSRTSFLANNGGNSSSATDIGVGRQCSTASTASVCRPWKTFRGHTNRKNFVGLSVNAAAGLMAVGSESNEVFTYHTSWSDPLASFCMGRNSSAQQQQVQQQLSQPAAVSWQRQQQERSVCAVAWRPAGVSCIASCQSCSSTGWLAAATSCGECRLLALVKP